MMAAQPTAMNPPATLALVDDDPAVRDLWARQFARRRTFLVTGVFADAESALPALLAAPPAIALVDWKLPGAMDGPALIARLKAAHSSVRAVLITHHDLEELPVAALRAGVDGCLLKPDSPAALPDRLHAVLAGTCVFSARVMQRLAAQLAAAPAAPAASAAPIAPAAARLSPTQAKILTRAASDGELRRKELAAELGMSPNTLDTHLRRAYQRLGVHRLGEALRRWRGGPPASPPPPVT